MIKCRNYNMMMDGPTLCCI